ncbi:thiolase family protein [Alteribacillus sp. YIM 98480]|uniref:thiolase family protein n=1 Tax=Alteribacillus sp. YIM 98480 TaxID=2606599 RepID=UPI00131C23CC|nr:thiolase family protein [Alteribacillus sp. YIM 98480]
MRDVIVSGVGMTKFGKFFEKGLKDLTRESVNKALEDAGVSKETIESAYVGNSVAGVITGQETIRGQVVLRDAKIGGIPIFNVENACASSSTAFHLASVGIAAGVYDCALIVGVEKMTHADRNVTFKAFEGGVDVEAMKTQLDQSPGTRSIFMDVYAQKAKDYMNRYSVTKEHLAKIAAKNHNNGRLNPFAQNRKAKSVEDVLNDRLIVDPFTRSMCSPVSDGAAALVLCSKDFAKKTNKPPVYLASSVVTSSELQPLENEGVIKKASKSAFEKAGLGPEDLDVIEVHDATASAELMAYEEIGLCEPGETAKLVDNNMTELHGKKPVNASGGLEAKGHPIGATGLGQIVELVWQLRGEAGSRQVKNSPKVGFAENAGGHLGNENAACTITILTT